MLKTENNPIGVFDSGVGGLSCVPAIAKALPNETIIYFGDTARAPYGSRDPKEITDFSIDVAQKLIDMGCKSLSIACNTITAVALDELKKRFDLPIIGIIEPAIEKANSEYPGKRIGLIATQATVNSGAYPFKAKATPDFVPYIEKDGKVPDEIIKNNLDEFTKDLDALILGCTHYPFIKDDIKRIYPSLSIIDPAKALAQKTKLVLGENNLLSNEKFGENKYISSSKSQVFDEIVRRIECTI